MTEQVHGAGRDAATVSILGLEDSERAERWALKRPEDWRIGRAEVPLQAFRERIAAFLESIREVIADAPETFGNYKLEQVQVTAEVSAKGQVSLLGSGGELAGKSGLTFTFVRSRDPDA